MDVISLNAISVSTNAVSSVENANRDNIIDRSKMVETSTSTDDATWSTKNFAQNEDQFRALTSTILDTSDEHTYDERLKAYASLFEMAVKGKLAGMTADDDKLYSKALTKSDIGIKDAQIRQQAADSRAAAQARGESTAVAQLKFVAGLSETNQKTYFTVTQNGFDMAGNRQYADIDAYRNQLVANAVHDYAWAAGKSQSQDNRIKGDLAGTAQALKGLDSKQLGSSWSTHILSLLGSNEAATSGWGDMNSASQINLTPKMPASYQPGNLFTRFG